MKTGFEKRAGFIALLLTAALSSAEAMSAGPRFLFLDPTKIVDSSGTKLTVNPPSRSEVVIRPDRPWEQLLISFYTTVREENGRLRMWYICRDKEDQPNVAYAESTDGVNWTKPNLGIVNYHGSTDNNLVGLQSLEGAVYRDPRGTGNEQYIYVTSVHKGGGIFRFASPDGLHWKRDTDPLLRFECDSQNVAFWDANKDKYVLYLRGWGPKGVRDNRRKVVRLEADSLSQPIGVNPSGSAHHENGDIERQPWIDREMPTVLACDENDPAGVDVYTNSVTPYPLDTRWYVGFPAFYRHFPNSPHPNDGRTEVQFIGSSDGIKWQRYARDPYVSAEQPGSLDNQMVFLGTGLVVRGDEIWQYGTRYRTSHGDIPGRKLLTDGAICCFVERVDGFVSLDFDLAGGRALCASVKVTGMKLLLNANTGALGELKVGLRAADGSKIPGFSVEDCDPVVVDSTGAVVTWHGRSELGALQGREVQFELSGTRAKLYSLRFE